MNHLQFINGSLNLDPASTFKFFLKGEEKLPDRVYLLNPASLNLMGYKVLAGFRLKSKVRIGKMVEK